MGRHGKQLVEEEVKPGSDTAAFLSRMEMRRLATPCNIAIDMRGKVPAECEAYEFQGLVHYMDEKCIEIFEIEAARFDGKYTVGVFEKVQSAEHTHKARSEREARERIAAQKAKELAKKKSGPKDALFQKPQANALPLQKSEKSINQEAPKEETESEVTDIPADSSIQLIPFGYRSQRKENRLNYSSDVQVFLPGDREVTGKTSDISVTGIKVSLVTNIEALEAGVEVRIKFIAIEKQKSVDFGKVDYRLIAQEKDHHGRVQLRLARRDQSDNESFNSFLIDFIQSHRSRYKIELEDKLLSLYARAYERIYTAAAPIANSLLGLSKKGAQSYYTAIRIGEHGEIKKSLLGAITSQLPYLIKKDIKDQSLLIETFLVRGKKEQLIYCANRDVLIKQDLFDTFLSVGSLSQLIARIHVSLQSVNTQDLRTLTSILNPLNEVDPPSCDEIIKKWEKVTHIAYFSLIEEKVNQDSRLNESNEKLDQLKDYLVTKEPERVWQLGYRNERTENRYKYSTPVTIKADKQTFEAESIDFSPSGIRLKVKNVQSIPTALEVNQMIKIALPEMQKIAKKSAKLTELSYRIIQWHPHQKSISLKRDFNIRDHHGEKFFTRLINANKSKLSECIEDLEFTLVSEMVESLISAYLHGIPLFLRRFPGGRFSVDCAAATENANELLWRFKTNDSFDFSSLNQEVFFASILKGNLSRRGQLTKKLSTRLFVTFPPANSEDKSLSITAEQDMKDTREIAKFILRSRKDKNSRILMAQFLPPPYIKLDEFSEELKEIRTNSSKKALEFEQTMQSLVAILDIEDVTSFYR